jgi:hypothetical protein
MKQLKDYLLIFFLQYMESSPANLFLHYVICKIDTDKNGNSKIVVWQRQLCREKNEKVHLIVTTVFRKISRAYYEPY